MILALLVTAAAQTALEAEQAFERDAQRIGQWSAFRKYADHDAVMFTPRAVWARQFLMDRKDPPRSISWRPAQSFVSCDGRTAVNTGPWFLPSGREAGFFTTVWQRTDRWRWVYDGGRAAPSGASSNIPQVHRASCRGHAPGPPIIPPPPLTPRQALTTPEDDGRGQSADKTLGWDWKVGRKGERHFRVYQWNGARYVLALSHFVPAP